MDSIAKKLNNEESLKDISPEAIAEFQKIVDASDGFLAETKNQNLKKELRPFVKTLRDMSLADMAFIKTAVAMEEGNKEEAQESLSEALSLRKQSLDYDRPLIDGTMKTKPTQKRLQPFTDNLEEKIIQNAESTIQSMNSLVDLYADRGDIENQDDAKLLQTHLTSIDHYVKTDALEKAVKHMKDFKQLVNHYQENGDMDKEAAKTLIQHADNLINKWQ